MRRTAGLVVAAVAVLGVLLVGGCGIFGPGTGACVSDAVQYTYGLRVYCYSDWSKEDCSKNDDDNVNGASWTFHEGQSCADRDLTDGSNPWP
ncbi:MAG: hypothetical protein FIA95_00085 [Gemmatimonadetes bacterium]|nr:hypothetical protein [Gemmatimonadota bacterium]